MTITYALETRHEHRVGDSLSGSCGLSRGHGRSIRLRLGSRDRGQVRVGLGERTVLGHGLDDGVLDGPGLVDDFGGDRRRNVRRRLDDSAEVSHRDCHLVGHGVGLRLDLGLDVRRDDGHLVGDSRCLCLLDGLGLHTEPR